MLVATAQHCGALRGAFPRIQWGAIRFESVVLDAKPRPCAGPRHNCADVRVHQDMEGFYRTQVQWVFGAPRRVLGGRLLGYIYARRGAGAGDGALYRPKPCQSATGGDGQRLAVEQRPFSRRVWQAAPARRKEPGACPGARTLVRSKLQRPTGPRRIIAGLPGGRCCGLKSALRPPALHEAAWRALRFVEGSSADLACVRRGLAAR